MERSRPGFPVERATICKNIIFIEIKVMILTFISIFAHQNKSFALTIHLHKPLFPRDDIYDQLKYLSMSRLGSGL